MVGLTGQARSNDIAFRPDGQLFACDRFNRRGGHGVDDDQTAQLVNDETSACSDATYMTADVKKNDTGQFKAKSQ